MSKTPSLERAEEYIRLGGRCRSKIDDNIISSRPWEKEAPESEAFRRPNIEALDEKHRQQAELHLPSISDR